MIAPFFGQIPLSLETLLNSNSMQHQIFFEIRLPRLLLAFFVGGVLALSGLIFQTIFKNPMSTPFTLGVASGATLFTAIGIVLGYTAYLSLFAFLGALMTIFLLFVIASRLQSSQTSSLLLVGIALSFFYSASLMVLFYISNLEQSYEIVMFTMGSLDIVGFENIYLIMIASAVLLFLSYFYQYEIKLLLTSNQLAHLKGINVKRVNYILLIGVSIAVGVAVSLTGPIGFVGLVIPHIIKFVTQKSADKILYSTFFYGGVFLVASDLIARNLSTASDVPIGVVTSFVGAPFFIYLIIKRR